MKPSTRLSVKVLHCKNKSLRKKPKLLKYAIGRPQGHPLDVGPLTCGEWVSVTPSWRTMFGADVNVVGRD